VPTSGRTRLVAPRARTQQLLRAVAQAEEEQRRTTHSLPAGAHCLQAAQSRIDTLEKRIQAAHRANPASKRLDAAPGFGVIVSSAVVATMTDPKAFKTGREFAAWVGLVPRQNSTGGKERLGSISKQGDRYLRRLLVVGALAVVKSARARPDKYPWVMKLLGRRPAKVVAVALANKMARIAWAILAKGETYRAPARTSSAEIAVSA
jgi:transposase